MQHTLLLCGASTRAAAWSAQLAGFHHLQAVDLFADADLARNCPVHRLLPPEYPASLPPILLSFPPGPFLYTGALENYPNIVSGLAQHRPLWGNPPETLRAVRDPFLLTKALHNADLPHPRVASTAPPSANESWLRKRKRSAAGFGIHPWQGEPLDRDHYLQELIQGTPHAAIFSGFPDRCLLLGVTRQLIGQPWANAKPFHYCGSVGPIDIGPAGTETLQRIGSLLAKPFNLRGLFGVDFILRDGLPYPVEVNPRYTASVEILERASTLKSLLYHRAAFDASFPIPPLLKERRQFWAKAILFARRDLSLPDDGPWQADLAASWRDVPFPSHADIPHTHSSIARGHPILTLFASAPSPEECVTALRQKARHLESRLYP